MPLVTVFTDVEGVLAKKGEEGTGAGGMCPKTTCGTLKWPFGHVFHCFSMFLHGFSMVFEFLHGFPWSFMVFSCWFPQLFTVSKRLKASSFGGV